MRVYKIEIVPGEFVWTAIKPTRAERVILIEEMSQHDAEMLVMEIRDAMGDRHWQDSHRGAC